MTVSFALLALVCVMLGGLLVVVAAILAYVMIRRKKQPPRGFEVEPATSKEEVE